MNGFSAAAALRAAVKCFEWRGIYALEGVLKLALIMELLLQHIGHFIVRPFTAYRTWHQVAGLHADLHPNINQTCYSLIRLN